MKELPPAAGAKDDDARERRHTGGATAGLAAAAAGPAAGVSPPKASAVDPKAKLGRQNSQPKGQKANNAQETSTTNGWC
jgi:hypothetical protein